MIIQSSLSLWQMVASVLIFVALKGMSMDLSDLEQVLGEAVRDCLRRARITEEQAADRMGMHVSSLRKCLRGEGQLQLGIARLATLGIEFMSYLAPILLYHTTRLHCEQVLDDAKDAAKAAKALVARL